jgi:hypothetical protein
MITDKILISPFIPRISISMPVLVTGVTAYPEHLDERGYKDLGNFRKMMSGR